MIYFLNKINWLQSMQWSLAHVVYSEYAEDTSENAVEIAFFGFSIPLVVY